MTGQACALGARAGPIPHFPLPGAQRAIHKLKKSRISITNCVGNNNYIHCNPCCYYKNRVMIGISENTYLEIINTSAIPNSRADPIMSISTVIVSNLLFFSLVFLLFLLC